LTRRLVSSGYRVVAAPGGAEAIELIRHDSFDLVLLDLEMPGMSGFEVLADLRDRHSSVQLPVIIVTACSDEADVVEAFRLGANDYVTKPVDFPVALARIETHLSHKWAVERLRESEERYALAAEGANDGLWDWNLATNEYQWLPRWKAMLGHADGDIGSDPDEWLTRVHPDDRDEVMAGLLAHLTRGRGHYESEHRLLHHDGTFRWFRCRGAVFRNGDG